ncbi:hypothetical protein EJ08DRAFT_663609 [Tothia fuscella]|uniref:Uncharacterized protein n=1 Tax=Tothia fuscella TaxID=1048955 RepID=A0A9P4NKZ5_9PEZI|nr:hypothetical protein EJ08DRAFT_663609 [Tothia fuscella]
MDNNQLPTAQAVRGQQRMNSGVEDKAIETVSEALPETINEAEQRKAIKAKAQAIMAKIMAAVHKPGEEPSDIANRLYAQLVSEMKVVNTGSLGEAEAKVKELEQYAEQRERNSELTIARNALYEPMFDQIDKLPIFGKARFDLKQEWHETLDRCTREHPKPPIAEQEAFLEKLKEASAVRNDDLYDDTEANIIMPE